MSRKILLVNFLLFLSQYNFDDYVTIHAFTTLLKIGIGKKHNFRSQFLLWESIAVSLSKRWPKSWFLLKRYWEYNVFLTDTSKLHVVFQDKDFIQRYVILYDKRFILKPKKFKFRKRYQLLYNTRTNTMTIFSMHGPMFYRNWMELTYFDQNWPAFLSKLKYLHFML